MYLVPAFVFVIGLILLFYARYISYNGTMNPAVRSRIILASYFIYGSFILFGIMAIYNSVKKRS